MSAYSIEIMPYNLRAKSAVIQTLLVRGLIVLGRSAPVSPPPSLHKRKYSQTLT